MRQVPFHPALGSRDFIPHIPGNRRHPQLLHNLPAKLPKDKRRDFQNSHNLSMGRQHTNDTRPIVLLPGLTSNWLNLQVRLARFPRTPHPTKIIRRISGETLQMNESPPEIAVRHHLLGVFLVPTLQDLEQRVPHQLHFIERQIARNNLDGVLEDATAGAASARGGGTTGGFNILDFRDLNFQRVFSHCIWLLVTDGNIP